MDKIIRLCENLMSFESTSEDGESSILLDVETLSVEELFDYKNKLEEQLRICNKHIAWVGANR